MKEKNNNNLLTDKAKQMARLTAKQFWALPKAKRKVLVAKDILKQIKAGTYNMGQFGYINTPYEFMGDEEGVDLYKDFKMVQECTVCELGACILSIGHLGNKLTFKDALGISQFEPSNSKAKKTMQKVFTPREIWFLEACFENGSSAVGVESGYNLKVADVRIAEKFYASFNNAEERSVAIAKNIIRNKGKFIPQQDIE